MRVQAAACRPLPARWHCTDRHRSRKRSARPIAGRAGWHRGSCLIREPDSDRHRSLRTSARCPWNIAHHLRSLYKSLIILMFLRNCRKKKAGACACLSDCSAPPAGTAPAMADSQPAFFLVLLALAFFLVDAFAFFGLSALASAEGGVA